MSPETQKKFDQVRKYSASLSVLFRIASAIAALGGAVGLLMIALAPGQGINVDIGGLSYSGDEITGPVKWMAAIGLVLGIAVLLKLLYHFGRLFGLYAKGEIFTADNVRQIRHIGVSVFLFTALWLYSLVAESIMRASLPTAAIVTGNDSGMTLNLPGPLYVVLAGIIIIVFSWIMDVGRALREEQDLTV